MTVIVISLSSMFVKLVNINPKVNKIKKVPIENNVWLTSFLSFFVSFIIKPDLMLEFKQYKRKSHLDAQIKDFMVSRTIMYSTSATS